jgi:alpha-L-fucosidase
MDRRSFLAMSASTLTVGGFRRVVRPAIALHTAAQLLWQRDELSMFIHFGVNTFTDREWGDGTESPSIFDPTSLDARQWARSARAAGFRAMILTAKHHDGFCLWPTATTSHSVASSPFRGGGGDVVREFVDACRAEGLRPGLYLSPWDRNNPAYGDSPRYNDLYATQLTELLTRYGNLAEVWFDGANGEGPNGKKQAYDFPRVFGIVRRLQPDAVIFSDAGPDVRWCGNEDGRAGDPNWSTVDPLIVRYPGQAGPRVVPALQHGDPAGDVWRPAEADVSIRPGWFYHAADDASVRDAENLVGLYLSSVGRNSKLLLNVPPTRAGLLHEIDIARLAQMRSGLDDMFGDDLAAGRRVRWTSGGPSGVKATALVDFGKDVAIGVTRISEDISRGQAVARYSIQVQQADARAPWQTVARGTTIGYARIDRFPAVTVRRLRVVIEETANPLSPVSVHAYVGGSSPAP